jgi:AcrR family transcriptional regulator
MARAAATAGSVAEPTRREQAITVARELLEAEGEAGLTMRRLADRMGIRAPSLYKHLPDKAALELALVEAALTELGDALRSAGPGLAALAHAYRGWGLAHPHLYALATERPLPRDRLPAGLEERAAEPLMVAMGGNEHRSRALWAAAHGLTSLELAGRFPPGADLDGAWTALVEAFGA